MPPTRPSGAQIRDGSIQRVDLDVTTSGQAVISRVFAVSANIALSSTGADTGTGDVTFDLTDTGIAAGDYAVTTVDLKGRVTAGRALLATDLPTSGVTPGTYTKYTVDTYGRVTVGASLIASDIPAGSVSYIQNQIAAAQTSSNMWISGVAAASELRAYDVAGVYYVGIDAPSGMSASRTFVLPATYGSNGDVLTGDGAGVLGWTTLGSTYVPVAGTTTITGAKTFSGGLTASALTVTGATTLATSLTGVLKATAGVVAVATGSDVSDIIYTDYAALLTAIPTPSIGTRAFIGGGGVVEYTASGWLGHIGVFANFAALPSSGIAPGSRVSVIADGTDYFYASSGSPHAAAFLDVAQTFTALQTFGAGLTVVGTTTLSTSLTGILKATAGVVSSATAADVTGQLLTGLGAGSNTTIVAGDSILGALANLQAQVTASGSGPFVPVAGATSVTGLKTFSAGIQDSTLTVNRMMYAGASGRVSTDSRYSFSTGYLTFASAAAIDSLLGVYVTGDTNNRLIIHANGDHDFGPGNAGADVLMKRETFVGNLGLSNSHTWTSKATSGVAFQGYAAVNTGSNVTGMNLGAQNASSADVAYARLSTSIEANTAGAHTGRLVFQAAKAGVMTAYASVGISGALDGFNLVVGGIYVGSVLTIDASRNASFGTVGATSFTSSSLTAGRIPTIGTSGIIQSDAGLTYTQASSVTRLVLVGDHSVAGDTGFVMRRTATFSAKMTWQETGNATRWQLLMDDTLNMRLGAYTSGAVFIDHPIDIVNASAGAITIGGSTARPTTFTGAVSVSGFTLDRVVSIGASGQLVEDGGLYLTKSSSVTRSITVGTGVAVGAPIQIIMDGIAGQSKLLRARTGSVHRWGFGANADTESGSSAGSNFVVEAYNDAGGLIDNPVFINRASLGQIILGGTNRDIVVSAGSKLLFGTTGNLGFRRSGDGFAVHFFTGDSGTDALLPDTTTAGNNPSLGNSGYRWNGVYSNSGDFSGTITTAAIAATGLTSGRVPVVTAAGLITDYASFTYTATGGHILTIGDGTSGTARLDINGNTGTTVAIRMRQAGIMRWAPLIDGSTTRFQIVSYDAAGTEIDRPLEIQNAGSGSIFLNRPTLVSSLTATQVVYAGTAGLLSSDAGFNTTQASGTTRALSIGDYATANDVFYVARQTSGQLAGYTMNDSAANRRWAVVIAGTDYRVGRWTNSSSKVDDPIIIAAGSAGAITIGGTSASPVSFTGTVSATGLATLAQATVSDLVDGRLVLASTAGRLQSSAKFTYNYSGVANIVIGDGVIAETSALSLDAPAGNEAALSFRSANVSRWGLSRIPTSLDFALIARNSSGVEIDKPLNVVNASAGTITIGGTSRRLVALTGNVSIGDTTAVTGTTNPRLTIYQRSDVAGGGEIFLQANGAAGDENSGKLYVGSNGRVIGRTDTSTPLKIQIKNLVTGLWETALGATHMNAATPGVLVEMPLETTGLAKLAQATVSDITATHVMFAGTAGRVTGHGGLTYDSTNGVLSVGTTGASQIKLTSVAGVDRLFYFTTAGALRAAVGVTNAAESGSDAGSNFVIRMRNDAGSAIDDPVSILRASAGLITIGGSSSRPVTFTGAVSITGATTLATSLTGLLKATAGVVSVAAASDVTGQLLTGFTVGSNTAIVAGDSILAAFGKTQGQIAAMSNFWSRVSTTVSLATSTDTVNLGTPTLTNGKFNVGGGSAGGSIVNSLSAGYRLLLHFDGNNGSRKIFDSGSYATPIYSRGTQYYNHPVISTTQSKFGGTSLRLDGTNYIEAASRFSIGTGDFSFDFHVYFTSVAGTQTIIDWGGAASGLVLTYSAGTWTFNVAGTACTFSNTPTVNTWYHIAVSRTSNSVRFWVAGTKTGTTQTAAGSVTATNTANMFIGATSAGANRSSFYLDEFRVVTGSSPFTSDAAITVPTLAYEPGGLRLAVDGTSRIPDNYVMASDGAGSFMPQRPPRLQVVTFCLGESVANTTKYFYSDRSLGTTQDDAQRSGNGSGMSFANACSPIFAGFTGRIVSAVLTVSGVGVNNGSVTAPVVYRADLFRVGFTAEHDPNINGGAAVQLNFSLPTTATVGTFSVGNTRERVVLQDLNIPVFVGDPLALKFINGSGASAAAMTMMAFVTLVIEETF